MVISFVGGVVILYKFLTAFISSKFSLWLSGDFLFEHQATEKHKKNKLQVINIPAEDSNDLEFIFLVFFRSLVFKQKIPRQSQWKFRTDEGRQKFVQNDNATNKADNHNQKREVSNFGKTFL
jgi:hypothetical protein